MYIFWAVSEIWNVYIIKKFIIHTWSYFFSVYTCACMCACVCVLIMNLYIYIYMIKNFNQNKSYKLFYFILLKFLHNIYTFKAYYIPGIKIFYKL